jgi:hypothetical protein
MLKDKTNREGLIENQAYHQFQELVKAAVSTLQKERDNDIKKIKKEKHSVIIGDTLTSVKSKLADVAEKIPKVMMTKL